MGEWQETASDRAAGDAPAAMAGLASRADAYDIARVQASILFGTDQPLPQGLRVLDLGSGDGAAVLGWLGLGADVHGCDFRLPTTPAIEFLRKEKRVAEIALSPCYRLPYPDGSFDCVVSSQVFEHVANYSETIRESRRVLKDNGVALDIFPSRLVPIEPHVFTPFGGAMQRRVWVALWTLFGVRTQSLAQAPWGQATDATHRYLIQNTNYLTGSEIRAAFEAEFASVVFAERAFLESSPNRRGRILARAGRLAPPLYWLYRVFWSRVVVCRSPRPRAGGADG